MNTTRDSSHSDFITDESDNNVYLEEAVSVPRPWECDMIAGMAPQLMSRLDEAREIGASASAKPVRQGGLGQSSRGLSSSLVMSPLAAAKTTDRRDRVRDTINLFTYCLVYVAKTFFISFNYGC